MPESTKHSTHSTLAPIVLFTYNRPKHTKKTLEALIANELAKDSELFVYQDGLQPACKNSVRDRQKKGASTNMTDMVQAHNEVREYIESIMRENAAKGYFKRVEFIQREQNLGLADSIIDGVSTIINTYGKIIVLEDDIVTSPVFLQYCNAALNHYKNDKRVWSISAWNYPIDTQGLEDSFFWRIPHCWGWASWSDRWQHVHRDIAWFDRNFDEKDKFYIDIDGSAKFFEHFLLNKSGKLKTWAIFNYLVAYKHHALTLMPKVSYIVQSGFDGSGVHCGDEGNVFNPKQVNQNFPINFPECVEESTLALERIRAFEHKLNMPKPFATRAWNKLRRIAKAQITRWGGGAEYNKHAIDSGLILESPYLQNTHFLLSFSCKPQTSQYQQTHTTRSSMFMQKVA